MLFSLDWLSVFLLAMLILHLPAACSLKVKRAPQSGSARLSFESNLSPHNYRVGRGDARLGYLVLRVPVSSMKSMFLPLVFHVIVFGDAFSRVFTAIVPIRSDLVSRI